MNKIKIWFKLELTSESEDGQIVSIHLIDQDDRELYIQICNSELRKPFQKLSLLQQSDCDNFIQQKTLLDSKEAILSFLEEYKGYEIQFLGNRCFIEWYHLSQLITEWEFIEEDITDRVKGISPLINLLQSQMEVLMEAKGRTICTKGDRLVLITKTKKIMPTIYTILEPLDTYSIQIGKEESL